MMLSYVRYMLDSHTINAYLCMHHCPLWLKGDMDLTKIA